MKPLHPDPELSHRARESGIRIGLAHRVQTVLEHWLTPVMAETVVRCAARRAKLDLARLHVGQLDRLARGLEMSLTLYLDPSEVESACGQIRGMGLRFSSRPLPGHEECFAVATESDLLLARNAAVGVARRIGFEGVEAIKVASVITELGRNVLRHAGTGMLKVRALDDPNRGICIVAEDGGPGIADVNAVLHGDRLSPCALGFGLQGVKRLVDHLEVTPCEPHGTRVRVEKLL